jgi:hypothetical protein
MMSTLSVMAGLRQTGVTMLVPFEIHMLNQRFLSTANIRHRKKLREVLQTPGESFLHPV